MTLKTNSFDYIYSKSIRNFGKTPLRTGAYKKKLNQYKTNTFEFNLNNCTAFSYNWWQFVFKYQDTIYFNNAHYSMQTYGHQRMAQNILELENAEAHGYKIKYVYVKMGLNNIDREIGNKLNDIRCIQDKMNNPNSRKKTNIDRVSSIENIRDQIVKLQELQKIYENRD